MLLFCIPALILGVAWFSSGVAATTFKDIDDLHNTWLSPSLPNRSTGLLDGLQIDIRWTPDLRDWYDRILPGADASNVSLWLIGTYRPDIRHVVAENIDLTSSHTSIPYKVNVPRPDLYQIQWWSFAFVPGNETYGNDYIPRVTSPTASIMEDRAVNMSVIGASLLGLGCVISTIIFTSMVLAGNKWCKEHTLPVSAGHHRVGRGQPGLQLICRTRRKRSSGFSDEQRLAPANGESQLHSPLSAGSGPTMTSSMMDGGSGTLALQLADRSNAVVDRGPRPIMSTLHTTSTDPTADGK